MKNIISLFIFIFSVQLFAASEEEFKNIFNEIIDGNSELFKEIIETNPDYHHDNLVESLINGDKPHVTEGLLEEITHNGRNTFKLIEKMTDKIKKNPAMIKRMNASLIDVRKQIRLGHLKKPSVFRCGIMFATYFSLRDFAYSWKATFHKENTVGEAEFADTMGVLDSGLKYYTPFLCLSEFLGQKPLYHDFYNGLKDHRNKKENIKIIQETLKELEISSENKQQMKKYINFSEEQKALLIKDVLKNKTIVTDKKILKEYYKFLKDIDYLSFIDGLSEKVSPELIVELKKIVGLTKKQDVDENKVMKYLGYMSNELDELFLREISRGGEEAYLSLKKDLLMARESEFKKSKIKLNGDNGAVRCMAFVGSSLFLGAHAAAIGKEETPFDNIDDTWYRKNYFYLFVPVSALTVPMCFWQIPKFIKQRKYDYVRKGTKELTRVTPYDWNILERKIEKAKKDAIVKGKVPKVSTLTLSKSEGKIFDDLMRGYRDIFPKSSTVKFHNMVNQFSSGEKVLMQSLVNQVKKGELGLVDELVKSSDQLKFHNLVAALISNDYTQSSNLIKEMKGNEADIIKYMVALQKKIKSDPILAEAMRSKLKELRKIMKLNKVGTPTPYACMTAIAGYFGMRDFLFSVYGSYIEKENTEAYTGLMEAATTNSVAFMGMFCIADMVMLGKEIPKYIKGVLADKNSQKLIKEMDAATKALSQDEKLRTRISRLKVLPGIEGKKELQFFDELIRKVTPELEESPADLKSSWRKYRSLGFLQKKILEIKNRLPLQDREFLNKYFNKGQFSSAADEKYNYIVKETYLAIENDFKKWIKDASPTEANKLLSEMHRLKNKQAEIIENLKKVPLGNKVCMWSIGTVLAGLGYSAAVGHKETVLDTKAELLERENAKYLYGGGAALFGGACGINAIMAVPRGVKRKNIKRDVLLKMEKKDWNTLEKIIYDTKKEIGVNPKAKGASIRAIDLLTNSVSSLAYGHDYTSKKIKKAKSKEEKFKKKMMAAKPGVLNIDKKCLEDGVKSILNGL